MASSTQTVREGPLDEEHPTISTVPRHEYLERTAGSTLLPSAVEERANLKRDGQRSSWPDMINQATEINLNIAGLEASARIGVFILLVLVLCFGLVVCLIFIPRWPTSSSPRRSQPSDAPTFNLSDISPLSVSTAKYIKNSYTKRTEDVKNQSAQAMSRAIAEFLDGEVSQILEKAIQDLIYHTGQNEKIEELQALNRELILKAYQEVVEEKLRHRSAPEIVGQRIAICCVALSTLVGLYPYISSVKGLRRIYQDYKITIDKSSTLLENV